MQSKPTTTVITAQRMLFDVLLKYQKKSELIHDLTNLLNLSKDAVYRRVNCDTSLALNEAIIIAGQYGVSLDQFNPVNKDKLIFSYNKFTAPINNFADYVEQIIYQLKRVQNLPDLVIYYASQEIPIFAYCQSRKLFSFKMYVYGKTSWNFNFLNNKKFTREFLPEYVIEKASEAAKLYNGLPSIDLWIENIADNTLSQIEYTVMTSQFRDPYYALEICDELSKLIIHLKNSAEMGRKFPLGRRSLSQAHATFDLYFNEMVSTNNTILVTSSMGSALYTTLGTPNFLLTTNQKMCNHMHNWYKDIIASSTPLSHHAGKAREWFFNRLDRKIHAVKDRIERVIMRDEIF